MSDAAAIALLYTVLGGVIVFGLLAIEPATSRSPLGDPQVPRDEMRAWFLRWAAAHGAGVRWTASGLAATCRGTEIELQDVVPCPPVARVAAIGTPDVRHATLLPCPERDRWLDEMITAVETLAARDRRAGTLGPYR